MKTHRLILAALAGSLLAACGTSSPVGLIDVQRIASNWPEYQSYQAQLQQDEQQIATSRAPVAEKRRAAAGLQVKYAQITIRLTQEIKDAARTVAQQKNLKLVVTREGVGYGGTDITPDVEKAMNITEKATPSPSP
ncbi:MAG: hypothetical protein ACLQPV_05980 [Vulcanimicrobiaceae bacterium]